MSGMFKYMGRMRLISNQLHGIALALNVFRPHKLRTALAMLGVFLGALLLTSILHILQAVTIKINQEAERLGSKTMTITTAFTPFVRNDNFSRGAGPAVRREDSLMSMTGFSGWKEKDETEKETESEILARKQNRVSARLSLRDIERLRAGLPQVTGAAPYIQAKASIKPLDDFVDASAIDYAQNSYARDGANEPSTSLLESGAQVAGPFAQGGTRPYQEKESGERTVASSSCTIMATTPSYERIKYAYPAHGRFVNPEETDERALVCVLGHNIATRLFGSAGKAVGRYIHLFDSALFVTGVMEERGIDVAGTQLDEIVFIPLSTYIDRFSVQEHLSGAYFSLKDRDDTETIRSSARAILRDSHRLPAEYPDDFAINFGEQVDFFIGNALRLTKALGYVGAGLSFAIGTLGILSIMTLLVNSRKLEIGIRRALGATRRDIVVQFISEASIMAGGGGLLGVVGGLALTRLLVVIEAIPPIFNPVILCCIFALSVGCGLLAGAYPAWKAAKTQILRVIRDG